MGCPGITCLGASFLNSGPFFFSKGCSVDALAGGCTLLPTGGGPGGIGPRRLVLTALLGMAGAIVGGFISTALGFGDVTGFNLRSIVIAAGGAILVIIAFRMLAKGGGGRGFA